MKKISYLLLLLLAFVYAGCADTEQPYVGYVIIERAVVEAEASSTTTITADTDIDSPMILEREWTNGVPLQLKEKKLQ